MSQRTDPADAAGDVAPPRARAILEFAIYGRDLPALERFYCDVLGLQVIARGADRIIALRCGLATLLLFDPERSRVPGEIPHHGATGPGHFAFAIEDHERPAWRARLERHAIPIEREIDWPEGGTSIYFRDPAGNCVELAPPAIWGGLGRSLLDSLDT